MTQFDPNAASMTNSGIFGLPFHEQDSALIYLPIPWEVTTSYGSGTSKGPQAILQASRQVDLFDLEVFRPYEAGLYILPESKKIKDWNEKGKKIATRIIQTADEIDPNLESDLETINILSQQMNQYVYNETCRLFNEKKIVGIIGGDHSVPFGGFRAASEKYPSFGILHFDAHSDTRRAFEGFTWSHASIMYNVLEKIPEMIKLVQVGIRDFCEEEYTYVLSQGSRVSCFYDSELTKKKYSGIHWNQIAEEIISKLPQSVWISFDIDGLDPRFCPHTGTPVPGGLDFNEAICLISKLVHSGRTIIGFDLNEVSPNLEEKKDEWDANVGARLLYKLSAWTLASQNKAKIQTTI